jgi:hypothetical protein
MDSICISAMGEQETGTAESISPKIAYTETVVFERSEAYQEIKKLSVGMMREMKTYKREKLLLQITELHQHMQSIVSAVLETIQKYSVS